MAAAPAGSADLPTLYLETPTTFPFPYPQPYSIQLDLMRTVFSAIEDGKIAIVESPTGTGKSLTLLTATLSWLRANAERVEKGTIDALEAKLRTEAAAAGDPPWVVKHALQAQVAKQQAAALERAERLRAAKEKERKEVDAVRRRRAGVRLGGMEEIGNERNYGVKRQRTAEDEGVAVHSLPKRKREEQEDEFLPEDGGSVVDGEPDGAGDGIRPELRALIEKYAGSTSRQKDEPEEETVTKIYYASRTHTQLRQLTSELLKTTFAKSSPPEGDATGAVDPKSEAAHLPVRMVPLGGRKQLCINERVRAIGAKSGDERMNEACLDLQNGDKKGRCEYLPPLEEKDRIVDFRDAILATVRDIEDIVDIGKTRKVCPYYAARSGVKQAELVTLPYNLLLQKNAREALGFDLKGQIIVIDEAHNLIDTLLSIHSVTLPLSHLTTALGQLKTYHTRFKSRLKPQHALHIAQTLTVISGLITAIRALTNAEQAEHPAKDKLCKVNELTAGLEGGADMVNLVDLVRYLKESKLARKVSSYVEKTIEEAEVKGTDRAKAQNAIAAFHQVETFLLSLAESNEDGRIVISQTPSANGGPRQPVIQYMLLNPAEHFKAVVDEARCVVLAGGTMEPVSDFLVQLFPLIPRDRITTLSCAHVIPSANLLAQVVRSGPSGKPFEFKMSSRGDKALMLELGACISSLINLIPDGVVVFFPSYTFLETVKEIWASTGLLDKLNQRKKLFYEPQSGGDVEAVLRDYGAAVANPNAGTDQGKRTGALLLAVVGAKLSEGINFSDSLGRAVVMVGLPFANLGSVELKERMRYVETKPNASARAGQELYENLCMCAVNQSIGRAIRHANDYATLLLLDSRYSTSRISAKLPRWIGADLQVGGFPEAIRGTAAFFRGKKAAATSAGT